MNPRAKIALMLLVSAALVWLVAAPNNLTLPDTVPAHLNFAGEIDRWGSKIEVLILPLVYTVGAAFAALALLDALALWIAVYLLGGLLLIVVVDGVYAARRSRG
ncbi:DUF1648 domain-containing protein [Oceanithermus sp.]|uniref:DUF1648 domain-containing protein n=1 Tax=Oceanithermus sp. TaxID=2268145 RepID=UPI002580B70F|nr:DUF1648 domain-containing protein [Oceanithermus sp.]